MRVSDSTLETDSSASVLRDDPTKSDMHNRQGLSVKMILSVIGDWRMWPLYALGLLHMGRLPVPEVDIQPI